MYRTRLGLRLACGMLCVALLPSDLDARSLFVSPGGDDRHSGSAPGEALARIQTALDRAMPGDVVVLLPGVYEESIHSVRSGSPRRPIRITGGKETVVIGSGPRRVVEITHDYVELSGFGVSGRPAPQSRPEEYRSTLVLVDGGDGIGLLGVRLLGMSLSDSAGECVRIKAAAAQVEVAYSVIEHCGMKDFRFGGAGKNGEAIYIGTAPEQRLGHSDPTGGNWIHHNTMRSVGECVDIKEGSEGNVVEHNRCDQQLDPESAGISVRGNRNIIRFNHIADAAGAGIRLGGDGSDDGVYNEIYGNRIEEARNGVLKLMRSPQELLCRNSYNQPEGHPGVRVGAGIEPLSISGPCGGV